MPLVVNKAPDTFRSGLAFWNSQTDVMSLATPSDRKVILAATLFICVRSSFPSLRLRNIFRELNMERLVITERQPGHHGVV